MSPPPARRAVLGIALLLLLSIDDDASPPLTAPAGRSSRRPAKGGAYAATSVSFRLGDSEDYTKTINEGGCGGAEAAAAAAAGRELDGDRWCAVDELLPLCPKGAAGLSSEWSDEYVVEPPYGCDCAATKSRYFCPSLGNDGYPKWVPHAVAQGACKSVTRSDMSNDGPFPAGFKVLFYGNSHVRQVVESIMCLFEDQLSVKRVWLFEYPSVGGGGKDDKGTLYDALIPGNAQCRACHEQGHPGKVTDYQKEMVAYECFGDAEADDACRCYDDSAEFFFENGAVVHYYYAGTDKDKSVKDVLGIHGGVPLDYYDVVFANNGNKPVMASSTVIDVAEELQAAGVPFIWLSTYDDVGDIGREKFMNDAQRRRFRESGAHYLGVDRMARGLGHLTKQAVESLEKNDPHYCLPGPPNEIGLLLLKVAWAVLHEKELER